MRVVDDATEREARRCHELAEAGHLVRFWALPAGRTARGCWGYGVRATPAS
ncbi:putative muconolactone isomerase [Mycobacterium ulcerans str. Harvey]|uniref:Muconolactone isomerase n=1 Tax=Mycobacterium ulcerans str. Harvey TaxID=1299332 RepID=A0ABN0QZ84_MYCUL|nr:putative muconolactone isomerase [Mycobacterium ulcerans str. Harvey]